MEVLRLRTSFRASNTRTTSMPFSTDFFTTARTTSSA